MQSTAESGDVGRGLPHSPELLNIAQRLIWWMPPEGALNYPIRFIAQVMTLGTWNDVQRVRAEFGEECLRGVLKDPPPGVFDQRSWHYWHHVFGVWQVPELPRRIIP
jgi:hypothetical protein